MSRPVLERHPWNTAFHWDDHDGPFTTITAEQARQYDDLGFFVFEDAFDAATLRELDEAIAPGEARARAFLATQPDGRFTVAGTDTQTVAPHLVLRSDYLRRFCAHPTLAGICLDLLGPDVRLYWEQAVYKQPHSAEPVLWHQDNGYTYVEPQSYLTCWIAITDATPENGCVTVMPGVHRYGTLAHRATPVGYECWGDHDLDAHCAASPPVGSAFRAATTPMQVPVRAGSIVVFTSLTPHYTARNTTDAVRKAYIVQYAPDRAVARRGEDTPVEVQDDPGRQFFVVRDGQPVDA